MNYLLLIVIARHLGADDFGQFGVLLSLALMLGFLGSFGQQSFLIKHIPKAQSENCSSQELGVYYFAATAGPLAALCGGIAFAGAAYYLYPAASPWAVGGGAALCFIFALSHTTVGALRVQERMLYALFSRDVVWRGGVVCILLLLVGTQVFDQAYIKIATIDFILVLMAVCLAPIVLAHIASVVTHVRKNIKGGQPKFKTKQWLETSSGLCLVSFISSADLYLYTIVIGLLVSSSETGAFFAALKTVELVNLFLIAVTLVFSSHMSRLVSQKKAAELQQVCNRALMLQGLPTLVCCLILILFAPFFLSLFQDGYTEHTLVLQLLALGVLVNALTGAIGLLMQLAGLHWRQVIYQGGSIALSLMLLPFLMSAFGIAGAALAFVVAKVIWNVAAIITLRRTLGVDPSLFGLITRNSESVKTALCHMMYAQRPQPNRTHL